VRPKQIWKCSLSNKYKTDELEEFLKEIKFIWPFKIYNYTEEDILEYLSNEDYDLVHVLDQFSNMVKEINLTEVKADDFSLLNLTSQTGQSGQTYQIDQEGGQTGKSGQNGHTSLVNQSLMSNQNQSNLNEFTKWENKEIEKNKLFKYLKGTN